MAKECPSRPPNQKPPRIFKNTYVRNGRTREVSGWAVRIQAGGVRKTFSLASSDRKSAALQAGKIHKLILTQGWDAALQFYRKGTGRRAVMPANNGGGQKDVHYWKQRLSRRKYIEWLQPGKGGELSVRIGDENSQYWFPLGTAEEETAAAKALAIHRTLEREGWKTVTNRFSREITIAIFWAVNPVAVTYTTIFTIVAAEAQNFAPTAASGVRLRVAVIEPDPGIRRALAFWLNRQPGVICAGSAADLAGLAQIAGSQAPDLLLFNRALPAAGSSEVMQELKTRAPKLPIFAYAVGEEI